MKRFIFLVILLNFSALSAQELTQTIRGTVVDKQTQSTLPGANVIVLNSDPFKGASSDENGKFRIEQVPIGRWQIKISFLGYKERVLTVVLTSGKESVLNIELEESVIEGAEVEILADIDKTKTNNKNAMVSARAFTIEEASRYAGSRNDPARMAANFAGVSGANDSRNDIIIRGNSPLGVLWRLNGLDIPNPNHFGSLGSTGGPISILNNNTLDNSDFLSSAFPADYGNATAGVFDLKMRAGNNEKYEFLAQMGFNGFELGAEGPFSKKKKNASFLVNYRYSTLIIFQKLGINFGTGSAIPQYQDLTFKADFPTKKFGKFSFFGIGGLSYIALRDSDKDKKENLYGYSGKDTYFRSNVGVAGMSHTYIINSSSYTKFNIAATGQSNIITADSLDISTKPPGVFPFYRNRSSNIKYTSNFVYNKKFNSRNFITGGLYADLYHVIMTDSSKSHSPVFYTLRDFKGTSVLIQAFTNWQHKFSDKFTINTGIHYQQFLLNNSVAVEPRAGVRYSFRQNQSISFGAGLHSQLLPMYVYFSTANLGNGTVKETNKNLDFSRSAHAVIAYDRNIGKNTRVKAEAYYQYLYRVPVKQNKSYFSSLNLGADFDSPNVDSLVNNGTGENYGMEFTLEKFYSKGYYYLLTVSLFQSYYTASDGIKRNTAFNGNYVSNFLVGKEFKIKKKHTFAIDAKCTAAGGKRYIPVDLEQSRLQGREVLVTSDAYNKKFDDYFRIDIKPSYRLNLKKVTMEWNCDFQNVTHHDNIFQQIYDVNTQQVATEYQLKFFFVPQFRLLF
ncbi:MAG: TonB-dependent receptor [Bacteroidia bacterium]